WSACTRALPRVRGNTPAGIRHSLPFLHLSRGHPCDFRNPLLTGPVGSGTTVPLTAAVASTTGAQALILWATEELSEGKKRSCCWAGRIHRTDRKPGEWQQNVLIDNKARK